MKNYYAFVEDHSGSMLNIARFAMMDSNANMQAVADAASAEKLDTVVSVIALGMSGPGRAAQTNSVWREHVISNPNVLKPKTTWDCPGGTPLYDAIWDAIELHKGLPDYNSPNVSFIIQVTTDGEEMHSLRNSASALKSEIESLTRTGRWTFVARMPRGHAHEAVKIGIQAGNVMEWDATEAGIQKATAVTKAATQSFFSARSAGATQSSSYFTSAANVDVSALVDITKEISLYQVPSDAGRLEIMDFILQHRQKYLKGAAFYQLVKTEAKVSPKKIILIRERKAPNRIFAGTDARTMLNLPNDPTKSVRVHPGDHGNYDIFIQSESTNRLLPADTGVIYWEKHGVPFTQSDLEKFGAVKKVVVPAAPVLPAVVGRTAPTKSPVPKKNVESVNGQSVKFFDNRQLARDYIANQGLSKSALGDKNALVAAHIVQLNSKQRWYVQL